VENVNEPKALFSWNPKKILARVGNAISGIVIWPKSGQVPAAQFAVFPRRRQRRNVAKEKRSREANNFRWIMENAMRIGAFLKLAREK